MISRYYGRYVELVAADRGVLAFVKWFVIGILFQIAAMLPAVPLVAAAAALGGDAGRPLAIGAFLAVFALTRVILFALPCARAAERKGLGWRMTWGAGGLLLGQWALALVAALPPKTVEAHRP